MTFNITFNDVLRAAIAEQIKPPVMQQAPDTAAQAKTRLITFDAKKIAKLIYDAKGTFIDDEDVAIEAIRQNIKNIKQYAQVTKELQKLTDGRGIGAYLQSFTNIQQRIEIAQHLADVLPSTQWDWTIKKIVPYADVKSYLGTTNAQKLRSGKGYNKFIVNLINDPKLYQSEFRDDASTSDFRDVSNIAMGTYQTFEEFANDIRDIAYSPAGIVASVVLEEIPYVNLIPVSAYSILLVDDVIKISNGNWDGSTIFDLIFDTMGVATMHPGIMKIVTNMLKGVFKFVIKPGAKLTSKIVRFLLEAFLKMSDDMLRVLERIFKTNLRGKLAKAIRATGKSISDKLEKAGLKKLANIVRRKTAEAELVIAGIYEMYIQPFFQQLSKIIRMVIEFPGKTIEYYLEKLGYEYSKQTGKIVKKATKVGASVTLFTVAFEKAAEWVESQQLKQLKQANEQQFKEWTRTFSSELRAQIVAITKKTKTPIYALDSKTKRFVYVGTYDASDDTIPMGKMPIIAHRDRVKNGYIQIEMWKDSTRSNIVSTIKLKTGETSYLFMKETDIEIANKKPLNSYSWSKGTK